MLVLHEEEPDYVCRFHRRPVVCNMNIQCGIKRWTCEEDKEESNVWSVLQRKPLRKLRRRRSRSAEDKIEIYVRKAAYEIWRAR